VSLTSLRLEAVDGGTGSAYLYYDVALSICSQCFAKVEGKIVFQDGGVYLLKRCPVHGAERVLIADDVEYYRRCREVFLKPPKCPLTTTRR